MCSWRVHCNIKLYEVIKCTYCVGFALHSHCKCAKEQMFLKSTLVNATRRRIEFIDEGFTQPIHIIIMKFVEIIESLENIMIYRKSRMC